MFMGWMTGWMCRKIEQQIVSQFGHFLEFLMFQDLPASFLIIDEPVVLKFSTNSSIDFLSGTASFWCDTKWPQKILCSNYKFPNLKKFQQQTYSVYHSKPWLYLIIFRKKELIRHLLDGTTIATCLSSLAPYRCHFEMWEIFLLHSTTRFYYF